MKQAGGHYHLVSAQVIVIIFTWQHQFGLGEHRIAAELRRREIAAISGRTVYTLLGRLGLPVRPYVLKGQSDRIAYRRYKKKRPNLQWHIDLKETRLADGTTVYICIVLDDHSRYVLAAVTGLAKTSTWTAAVVQQAVD